jgi:UDP-glucose 4-epimerase
MKCLVTGAAGFIGSHIVEALLLKEYDVVGYDNMSTGQTRFIEKAQKTGRFELVEGDVLDVDRLSRSMADVSIVYHLAANADIRGGLADPKIDIEQNTIATFNVLEAMRSQGVRRIAFASSAAALGEPTQFPTPEECSIPRQTSLYGASKMAGEGLISAYCEGFGFEGYAFRFVSILGSRYPHGHVFDFVKQLIANPLSLTVLGDGTAQKSYLNIADCVAALMLICEDVRPAQGAHESFQVFHLGYPGFCQVKDSVGWICSELELSPQIIFGGGKRGWIGDNPFVFLDPSKATKLGWEPKNSVESSIRETAKWLSDNQWIFGAR